MINFIPSCNPLEEEIGHQKAAAEYVRRELREADEANLLDEEGVDNTLEILIYHLKFLYDKLMKKQGSLFQYITQKYLIMMPH